MGLSIEKSLYYDKFHYNDCFSADRALLQFKVSLFTTILTLSHDIITYILSSILEVAKVSKRPLNIQCRTV